MCMLLQHAYQTLKALHRAVTFLVSVWGTSTRSAIWVILHLKQEKGVRLSVHPVVHHISCLSICQSACISLFVHLSVCLSVCLPVCLPVCQSVMFNLTIPFEESMTDAARRKRKYYTPLKNRLIGLGWWTKLQVGSNGLLDLPNLQSVEQFA